MLSTTQVTSSWSCESSSIVVRVPSVIGMSVAEADGGVGEELDSWVEAGCLAVEDMLVDRIVLLVLGAMSSTFCSDLSD